MGEGAPTPCPAPIRIGVTRTPSGQSRDLRRKVAQQGVRAEACRTGPPTNRVGADGLSLPILARGRCAGPDADKDAGRQPFRAVNHTSLVSETTGPPSGAPFSSAAAPRSSGRTAALNRERWLTLRAFDPLAVGFRAKSRPFLHQECRRLRRRAAHPAAQGIRPRPATCRSVQRHAANASLPVVSRREGRVRHLHSMKEPDIAARCIPGKVRRSGDQERAM